MTDIPAEITNPVIALATLAGGLVVSWTTTKWTASSAHKKAEAAQARADAAMEAVTAHRLHVAENYASKPDVDAIDAKIDKRMDGIDAKIDRRMDGIENKIDRLTDKFVNPASKP
jgi:flagellar basal body-associated protein FliL